MLRLTTTSDNSESRNLSTKKTHTTGGKVGVGIWTSLFSWIMDEHISVNGNDIGESVDLP